MNLNVVALTGNLTRDPELRHLPSGTAVCKLRIAVNERVKEHDEWKDRANYFDITVWGRHGENCAEHLFKGRPVAVQGRLRWSEWTTNTGDKRQGVEVVADTVQFLRGRDDDQPRQSVGASEPRPDHAPEPAPAATSSSYAHDDDIPF